MARRLRPSRTIEPYYGEVVPGDTVSGGATTVVEETVTVADDSTPLWPWLVGLGLALLFVVGYVALQEDDDAVVVPVNSPAPATSVFIQQPPPQAPPVIVQQPPQQQPPVIIQQQPAPQQSAPQQSAPPAASQPAEPAPSAS